MVRTLMGSYGLLGFVFQQTHYKMKNDVSVPARVVYDFI